MHRICHIAEVLLSLQQVGNVKYIGWNLQVVCSTEPEVIVTSLQLQIEEMEAELDSWKLDIQSIRSTFYELNYFTTTQLLVLRQALAKLKHDDIAVLDADVLALLQSVHPKVDSVLVANSIKEVMREISTPDHIENIPECCEDIDVIKAKNNESMHQDHEHKVLSGLVEENLSESQVMIMSFVVDQLGCSKKIVLKAFEKFHKEKKDKYDYLDICTELMNDNDVSDSESENSSEDSVCMMPYDDDNDDDIADLQGAG